MTNTMPQGNPVDQSLQTLLMNINNKEWDKLWDHIQELVESFSVKLKQSQNVGFQNIMKEEGIYNDAVEYVSIMADLLLSLMSNKDIPIPDKNFHRLMYSHELIDLFMSRGDVEKRDDYIKSLAAKGKKLTLSQQKRLALLLPLSTKMNIVKIIKNMDVKYRASLVSAYIAYLKAFDKQTYENKIKLFSMAKELEKGDLKEFYITALSSPYFACSYVLYDKKHEIKKNVNNAMRRYHNRYEKELREELGKLPVLENKTGKPRMLVVMEYFSVNHAMTRSWLSWIESMKSEFDLHYITQSSHRHAQDKMGITNVHYHDNDIKDFIKVINHVNPDLLFMPSVGMTIWTIIASNIRLAPLQIMGLGHPASTMSEYIDFVYGQSHLYHPDAFPTDKFIIDDADFQFSPQTYSKEILNVNHDRGERKSVRVSIVGAESKIIYPFIDLLRQIEEESEYRIEFSFHLSSITLDKIYAEDELSKVFGDFKFYGWQPYADYIQTISESDIVLNPFPFGHTNTVIDTLLLGKPCVGLEGTEPSSRTEKYILGITNLADQFLAKDLDDYKNKFHKLSHEIMNGKTEFCDRHKIYDILYSEKPQSNYASNMKWVYDNREILKSSDRKSFVVHEDI